MKYDYKKHEKELYGTKKDPVVITVPRQNFIMIQGEGNPNLEDFSERVGILYSLSHPVKMQYKKFCMNNPEEAKLFEYPEYAIFPLEGVWTSSNPDNPLDKNSFIYTIMIKQPNFITREMFDETYESVSKKKPHPLLKEVKFDSMEDGKCIQILHHGSFDEEPESFAKMDQFADEMGLKRFNHLHREIYLSDARKTSPEKLRTILRYQVK